jgi:hypothetical protein
MSLSPVATQIVLIILFGMAMGVVAFPALSNRNGWTRGTWASNPGGWINLSGVVGLIGFLGLSIWQLGWLSALLTAALGTILAFVLVHLLKSHFQWLAVFMPVLVVAGLALVRAR